MWLIGIDSILRKGPSQADNPAFAHSETQPKGDEKK